MSAARAVAFLPYSETSWSRMLPQIELVHAHPDFDAHVVLAAPAVMGAAESCRARGFAHVVLGPFARQDRGHFPALGRWWSARAAGWPGHDALTRSAAHDRIAHALPVALVRMARARAALGAQADAFRALFDRLRPLALFTQGDRELGPVPGALKAAGERGTARIIAAPGVPSATAMGAVRRGQARFKVRVREFAPALNLLAAARYPGQVRDTEFGRLLFSPGWLTLALAREDMLSANPWCLGGGHSEHVLVDSEQKRARFLALGVAPDKPVVIGDVVLDPLHAAWSRRRSLRAELCARYGLDGERALAVVAVPIYGEHDIMPFAAHLSRLEECFAALAARTRNVLLSLHPRSRRKTYEALAARHGLRIADHRLAHILPAADLFLCGSSSTIEWAVLCGIPTINLDYAGIDDDAFAGLGGTVRAVDAPGLGAALDRFDREPGWREQLARAQRAAAPGFALFDGKAADRFVGFVERLAEAAAARAGDRHRCAA